MAKSDTHTAQIEAGELIAPAAGIDINAIANIGAEARGAEVVTVKAPDGLTGIPGEIPILLKRGHRPEIEGLHSVFQYWRTRPERKRGTATAGTLESFIALTNRHKTDHSVVFAQMDWRKPAFTAVIDYHEKASGGAADNLAHRIRYEFPLSEEWNAWAGMNGQKMGQEDFATFLEDRIADLSSPTAEEKAWLERDFATKCATPAELIALSRGLSVHVNSAVKNTVALQSGEGQIVWEETHTDSVGNAIKVPGMFLLSIAPFFLGETVRVPVRLRYRVSGGKLVWFYQIYRPDLAITQQVRDDLSTVARATELPTYEGTPEALR